MLSLAAWKWQTVVIGSAPGLLLLGDSACVNILVVSFNGVCLSAAQFCRCVQTVSESLESLWGVGSLVRARLIGSLFCHTLCDWRSTLHYYDTLTTLQARTLTTLSLLAASLLSLFLRLHSPFQRLLQHLHRLHLLQWVAAAPQATCYPFGDEQSSSVSGLRHGK